MNSRKYAVTAGILFIIGTAAGILSVAISGSIIDAPDYLSKMGAHQVLITFSALLVFIMGAACAGTTIAMYPVLKRSYPALAIGSAGFRLIEGTLAAICCVFILCILSLSREFIKNGADVANYQITGLILMAGRHFSSIAMLFAWCIAAFMYYSVFYQTKLIPRWLSGWGIIGIVLAVTANTLDLFNIVSAFSPVNGALNAPIAIQEMVMAAWMIAKGFNLPAEGKD